MTDFPDVRHGQSSGADIDVSAGSDEGTSRDGAGSCFDGMEICNGRDDDCDGTTDEAGCPETCAGLTNGDHVYMLCGSRSNWDEAAGLCEVHGMRLAVVETEDENAWIAAARTELLGPVPLNLGGTDRDVEGVWVWQNKDVFWKNGSSLLYTAWAPTEPNDLREEDCLEMADTSARWNDHSCEERAPFICETL